MHTASRLRSRWRPPYEMKQRQAAWQLHRRGGGSVPPTPIPPYEMKHRQLASQLHRRGEVACHRRYHWHRRRRQAHYSEAVCLGSLSSGRGQSFASDRGFGGINGGGGGSVSAPPSSSMSLHLYRRPKKALRSGVGRAYGMLLCITQADGDGDLDCE